MRWGFLALLLPGFWQLKGRRYLTGLVFLVPSLYAIWNIASSIIGFSWRYYSLAGAPAASLEEGLLTFRAYAIRFAASTIVYVLSLMGSTIEHRFFLAGRRR